MANYFSTNKAHGHLSNRWFPRLIKIKNLELLNDFDGIILGTITTIPVSAFGDGNKIENLPDGKKSYLLINYFFNNNNDKKKHINFYFF